MPIKRFNLGLFVALTFIGGVFACGEEDTTPDSNTQVNAADPFTLVRMGLARSPLRMTMRWNTPQNWMGCKEHCDWLLGILPMTLGVNRRSSSEKMYF